MSMEYRSSAFLYNGAMLSGIFGVLALMHAISNENFNDSGSISLLSMGAAAVFYVLYMLTRKTYLEIYSRSGLAIKIQLTGAQVESAKYIVDTVEFTKLSLE